MINQPDSDENHRGPVWVHTLAAQPLLGGWLRPAIAEAARWAYQHWFAADDLRLEMYIGHAREFQEAAYAAQWTVDLHGPLRVMLPLGRATILWTWPDENSVSLLDAGRDGRRVIVRRDSEQVEIRHCYTSHERQAVHPCPHTDRDCTCCEKCKPRAARCRSDVKP
jgi:hypothetical protein